MRARVRAWGSLLACVAGVVIAGLVPGASWPWFGGACLVALCGIVAPARWWGVIATVCLVCASCGWATLRLEEPRADRVDSMVADGAMVTLGGVVREGPRLVDRPQGAGEPGWWRPERAWFSLRVAKAGDQSASGVVRVYGPVGLVGAVDAGDVVQVDGLFARPRRATNPGEPDWWRTGNERGWAGTLAVGDASLVRADGRVGGVDAVLAWWSRLRAWARDRALRALGEDGDGAGVVGALVLGERDASFEGVYRVFQRAGVAHVLAVSGFHLALLGAMGASLVRASGERGRLETLSIIGAVVVMLAMVPARSPVLRAGVLVCVLLLGDALGRRWDRLAVLGWAGAGLLVWRPGEATGLGFLLSVGVTGVLLGLGERSRRERWALLARRERGLDALRRRAGDGVRANLACWASATPVIVAATGVCSLIAPVASLLIVPPAALLLALGWAQAALGVVSPGLSEHTRPLIEALGHGVGVLARWVDGVPFGDVRAVGVGWVWGAACAGAVLGWVFVRRRRVVFGAAAGLLALYAVLVSGTSGRVDGLRADMLDVGDGTCVIVRSGGEAVLWDCGSLERRVGGRVGDAARALGVRRVRTAVLTHDNLDHFNALPEAAEFLGVERLLVSPAVAASREGAWGETRERLESLGVAVVPVRAGDRIPLGDAVGEVLWAGAGEGERWRDNEGSLVVRFVYLSQAGERSLLMCGDVQGAGVAGLLAGGAAPRATVIEVPHHGSARPEGIALVEGSGASVVLQSTGPSRVNDARWAGVRECVAWWSTAEHGAVHAWIRPDGEVRTGGFVE